MNPYNNHAVPTVFPTNNGAKLRQEFARVAALVKEECGIAPSAVHSFRDPSGLWECRDERSDLIAEVHGSTVTVVAERAPEPALGLLDRIADLRRAGLSTTAVLHWFGDRHRLDPTSEAALCVRIAARLGAPPQHVNPPIVPRKANAPARVPDDPWRWAR